MIMAVYGTLKNGFRNNYLLRNSEFIKDDNVSNMDMYSAGGFPYATMGEGSISVELYNVDEETKKNVDRLEGFPGWYDCVEVTTDDGVNALIYVMHDVPEGCPKVESGVW